MSEAAEPSDAKPKKPLFPPSRIVVIVFAVLALIVVGWELNMQSAWKGSYNQIDQRLAEANQSGETLHKKDIDALLKGSPDREPQGDNGEVLSWNGVLKVYRIHLQYGVGESVSRVEGEQSMRFVGE